MSTPRLSKKSFFGAAIGTMVEYYDYAAFGIFMPIFSPLFFPSTSTYNSLLKGYLVIWFAMMARPLGGMAFGYLGDVLGRRKALLLSMYGIAFATTLIGIVPSYASIGIMATILVIAGKAIQAFCFSGEFNGAGIYVVEHAQNHNENLISCLLTATTLCGSLIASFFGIIATYAFMPAWSWRVAFILGGFIAVFGILYRKNMLESPHFQSADKKTQGFISLIKSYPREMLAGIFIGGFSSVPAITVLQFINPVLSTTGFYNQHQLMLSQTFLIFCGLITLVVLGLSAKRRNPGHFLMAASLLLAFLAYPLLYWVDSGNLAQVMAGLCGIVILNEVFLGPIHFYYKNAFKMQYRYRGSSLSFCLGVAFLGGSTPIIEGYLYKLHGHFTGITPWLVFVSLGTAWSLAYVSKKQEPALQMALDGQAA